MHIQTLRREKQLSIDRCIEVHTNERNLHFTKTKITRWRSLKYFVYFVFRLIANYWFKTKRCWNLNKTSKQIKAFSIMKSNKLSIFEKWENYFDSSTILSKTTLSPAQSSSPLKRKRNNFLNNFFAPSQLTRSHFILRHKAELTIPQYPSSH